MTRRFSSKILLSVLILAAAMIFSVAAFATEEITEPPVVDKKVVSFSVLAGEGAKTAYREGDLFDPTGYSGTITYNDGTNDTVEGKDLLYNLTEPLKPTDTIVTFSCAKTQITSGLPITVAAITGLRVKTQPAKVEYYAGEKLDLTGIELELQFESGDPKSVDVSAMAFSRDMQTALSGKDSSVVISYTESERTHSVTLNFTVIPISKLSVTVPQETTYYAGQSFTTEGLKVSAEYSDGFVNNDFTEYEIPAATEPLTPDGEGFATLSVVFDDKSADFKIPVISVASFNATLREGGKASLYYGDVFDPATVRIFAVYTDGTEIDVSEDVIWDYPEVIRAEAEIKASFNGTDITDIPVAVRIGLLDTIMEPSKTVYSAGETFDPTGMIIAVIYDDKERETLDIDKLEIDASAPLTEGDSFVTVRYYGLELKVPITVKSDNPIIRIDIYDAPDQLKYVSGQTFNTEGLIIVAYYENSDMPQILNLNSLEFSPSLDTPLTSVNTKVAITLRISDTVKYTVEQPIEVENKIPSRIFVTREPNKTEYQEGEKFDPTGLEVSIYYNDGTTVPLTAGFTFFPTEPFTLSSNQKETVVVTIEYPAASLQCHQAVTVLPSVLKDITIAIQPDKTTYNIGERFDPTGMKLILTYLDNTLAPVVIPDADYIVSPSGPLTANDSVITITYRGLTTKLNIKLNGGIIPPVTTDPTVTQAPVTTQTPTTTSEPIPTTTPDVEVTTAAPTTTEAPAVTTASNSGTGTGGNSSMLILWIVILGVILIALIALIIFYKRNFT